MIKSLIDENYVVYGVVLCSLMKLYLPCLVPSHRHIRQPRVVLPVQGDALFPSHQHSNAAPASCLLPPGHLRAWSKRLPSCSFVPLLFILFSLLFIPTPHPSGASHHHLLHPHFAFPFQSQPSSLSATLPSRQKTSMSSTHILRTVTPQAFQDTSDLSTSATVATSRPLPPLIDHACHQRILEETWPAATMLPRRPHKDELSSLSFRTCSL